jgi:hypothetical protein
MKLELNDKEDARFRLFCENHHECSKAHLGAIGGHFSIEFGFTSIGETKVVKCFVCKAEKNITDFDCW